MATSAKTYPMIADVQASPLGPLQTTVANGGLGFGANLSLWQAKSAADIDGTIWYLQIATGYGAPTGQGMEYLKLGALYLDKTNFAIYMKKAAAGTDTWGSAVSAA